MTVCFVCDCEGGGSKEQLPMVLKVPRLKKSTLSVCLRPYSLLGFGDILVPGKCNRSVARICQRGGHRDYSRGTPSGDHRLYMIYTAGLPHVSAGSVVLSWHEGPY